MQKKKWIVVSAISLSLALFVSFQVFASAQQEEAEAERPVIDVTAMLVSVHHEEPEDVIARDRVKKYLEERFSFNLTYKSFAGSKREYGQVVVREMAAGDAADLVDIGINRYIDPMEWREWVKDELVVNLGDYVFADPDSYPVLKLAFDHPLYKYLNEYYSGDADQYYLWYSAAFRERAYGGITFNGYLLEELGLDVPQTYDELVAAMRRAKEKNDIPGFGWVSTNATSWGALDKYFFNPFGLNIGNKHNYIFQDEDGNWYDARIDPRNRERWRELQRFMKEGLLDPKWISNNYDVLTVDFIADKILAVDYGAPNPKQYTWAFEQFFQKTHPDADPEKHMPMPPRPLRGPGGVATHSETQFYLSHQFMVPYTTKHPERIIEFMNFLASDEWQAMIFWGIKGIHYTKDDKSDFDEAEFLKDTGIWFPVDSNRSQYPWFRWFANGGQWYSPFEKYGDWVKGLKAGAMKNPQTDRLATSPAWEYAAPINQNYIDEGSVELPPYQVYIAWTEEEEQIRTKLYDIRNTWFTWFLTGEEDLDQGWDNFVKQYKAAGGDRIAEAFGEKMDKAKATYDKYWE